MKCYINLKSFNYIILEIVSKICLDEAKKANFKKASIIRLPKRLKKFSLIKSPHVHKKSREQFEILNYNRILCLEGPKEKLENIVKEKLINNKYTFFFKIKWQQ
jgi:small subunit ribosomal protein S10